ncbi:MAG: hypothetical protein WC495_04955 [Patescibacteria group bacterium]|jgi:hypothetical protein
MTTTNCEWVIIDGKCYVPCLNSVTLDVDCGEDFDLKKDKASVKKAMHAMKIEHDKEVMEDEIEAEIKERQDTQVKLFEQLISRKKA